MQYLTPGPDACTYLRNPKQNSSKPEIRNKQEISVNYGQNA
jgi:hypothetical protein